MNKGSSKRPVPFHRTRSKKNGVSFSHKPIPQRLPASKRVSFKTLQNANLQKSNFSASKPQSSMTQKNKENINPIIKDEIKFNFTDPLRINTNLVKIKNDLLSDYINYLVELKTMSEKPKSIFTKSKISDIIDSIDKKLRQLQKIRSGDLQRENS
jgi:hypothetical protein